jgi:putative transposase
MIRSYRYPLQPTQAQETTLSAWLDRCRWLYNAALQERRDAWQKQHKSITRYDQQKSLTEIRSADAEWAAVPAQVLRSALYRVDLGMRAFFRRCKLGGPPGFPRFRGRDRYDSFGLMGSVRRVDGNRIKIPKLGAVKFKLYRPIGGKILDVKFKCEAGRWYVILQCDVGAAPAKRRPTRTVGIDLGLTTFATLSTSEKIDNPRHYRMGEDLLAKQQRALQHKRKRSNSRRRAKLLVAKTHLHVRNQRLDFARKLAKDLATRFDLIAHEDLSIRNMVHGNLAKSIHDAGWSLFLHALACKAEEAGVHVVAVDPRGTTQRCSACGDVVPKGLADRVHDCPCGLRMCRDLNAAINIQRLGLSLVTAPTYGATEA